MKDKIFKMSKLKYICSSMSTSLGKESLEENGIYPVYGASGLIGMMSTYQKDSAYLGIVKDGAGVGRIEKYPAYSSLLGTLSYITPNIGTDIDWLNYTIQSLNLNESLDKTTIPHIYFSEYGNREILICDYYHQKKISSFLNTKCSEIDSLVADITKEIELLKEYRKSVIYEAVTKGLNTNVKMKDSGTNIIPTIPNNWKIGKVLYYLSMPITDGPHITPILYDEGIPFISAEAISCGNGRIDFNHMRGFISEKFYNECCLKYIPQIDDIYMIKSGATTGKVAIVDSNEIFTIWSPLAVFRCNNKVIMPYYLFYFLQSDIFQKQVQQAWNFGTQQNIGMRDLEKLKIIIPPLDEQQTITSYLFRKCSEIDSVISEKEQQIDKLMEYKKSLIYEYVTGKKEVNAL